MIIVTGAAGFIGSNIVKRLNEKGYEDIVVVDDLRDGKKFRNLADCRIADYVDFEDFLVLLEEGRLSKSIDGIFHEGACSDTTEWDGRYMMHNNYDYSKAVLQYAMTEEVPFIYASSAAVYGANTVFDDSDWNQVPLNVYGYSKFLFDQYVKRMLPNATSQVIGLRYFNVYGPRESHKKGMASVAFHFNNQLKETGHLRLFEGCDGYGNGEQTRDFVFVEDVVDVNLWLLENQAPSGIYNVGTGRSEPFNAVANAVIDWHGKGSVEYIPFPEKLKGCYQSFTQANIEKLRQVGYDAPFKTVAEGVKAYLDVLNAS